MTRNRRRSASGRACGQCRGIYYLVEVLQDLMSAAVIGIWLHMTVHSADITINAECRVVLQSAVLVAVLRAPNKTNLWGAHWCRIRPQDST